MKQDENSQKSIRQLADKSQNYLKSFTLFGLFIFLLINLISSQFISPLYFQFINDNINSTITFLHKIKTLPEYSRILEMNNNIFGDSVKVEIFAQENRKKEIINNLEQQLIINPKARDILYSLYKLYLVEGETGKAREYLRRAKEVDPAINPTNTTNPDQSDK